MVFLLQFLLFSANNLWPLKYRLPHFPGKRRKNIDCNIKDKTECVKCNNIRNPNFGLRVKFAAFAGKIDFELLKDLFFAESEWKFVGMSPASAPPSEGLYFSVLRLKSPRLSVLSRSPSNFD